MSDRKQLAAENIFSRAQKREIEINEALKQKADRHAAAVKNM